MAEPKEALEVVEAVKKEIKTFGEGIETNKQNYTELKKEHEDLKKELTDQIKNKDGLIEEKIVKLTEAITTRQEDMDNNIAAQEESKKEIDKRIDQIEVAFKRIPKSSSEKENKEALEAKDFMIDCMVVNNKSGSGARWNHVAEKEVDVDGYKSYKGAFNAFIRTSGKGDLITVDDQKALTLGTDPDGGYTVTPVMSNRIIMRQFESDPMRQMASIERISTDAIEWMVDYDQAGFGWESETVAGPETITPKWFKKRIPVHIQYATPRASQTLLEDSGINIENWLADKVSSRFSRGEAAAFISGNGVGKPRGILTYDNYDTAGADEYGKIERINMGAAAALTTDGFIDVKYSLVEQYLDRGTWLMNRLTVADTMKLKDGEGNYIWKAGLAEDRHGTILGMPLRMSTTMPVVAAGALSVAIADWSETYMIVDRLGITIQRDPFTARPFVEFYTRKRVGGDVINYQSIKIGVIAA